MALLPKVKLKTLPTFPSNIIGGVGITATKSNGAVTIDMEWNEFGRQSMIPTSPTNNVLTFDTATESYVMIPSSLLGGAVAGISDAPIDGTQYGRQSAAWTPITSNFIQAGTGAVTRTMQNKARDIVSVKDFGAVGNGTADDTAAIQATINAVAAAGGGEIYLPGGTYKISSRITINASHITFAGTGKTSTVIAPNFGSDHAIVIGGPSAAVQSVVVSDLSVKPSVTSTSGAGIIISGNNINVSISNVLLDSMHDGIVMDSFGAASVYYVNECYIGAANGSAIKIGTDNGIMQDAVITQCIIAVSAIGIECYNASGFYADHVDIILCTTGVLFDPPPGMSAVFGFFDAVLTDTSSGIGWFAVASGGKIAGIVCNSCWAAASAAAAEAGIFLNSPTLDGFIWSNGQVRANQRHGMEISAGANIIVTGSQIFHNSATSGTYHGIVVGAGVTDITITDNKIGRGGFDALIGTANLQGYGIFIAAGVNNIVVQGNNLTGNVIAGMADSTTPSTNKVIRQNIGYVDRNSGQVSLGVGGAAITVTHGLAATPFAYDIGVLALSSPGSSGVTSWWVDTITATTFVIRTTAVVTGTALVFGWNARTPGVS